MKNKSRIIYWIATIWLSLGMVSTGIVQLIQMDEEVQKMDALGYPSYLLTIIGVWKILGVLTILLPRFPLVKEWAYAGFFFLLSGAVFTHVAMADGPMEYVGPALLLLLTGLSWYFRPPNRKLSC
ncbi:DoxX family protein [Sphingobacterium griseoflavum]|uniref:Membrane protein n=1 Tax=Sphingobacterium griseoflavum TaxID=1474952 RepID=A0ABQ3HXX7_9SPHI|nr:DoxX family protein [Sphingobacterium griseoflavum]GHE30492.1 membrane protein [Sphingobacterium griseoflavum]